MTLLSNLQSFPLYCSYVWYNPETNEGLLEFTNDSLNKIAHEVSDLRKGIHENALLQSYFNAGKIQLTSLISYDTIQLRIFTQAEGVMLFNKLGYKDMGTSYNNTQYKLVTSVKSHYDRQRSVIPLVYVTLKASSPEAILVGIFDSKVASEEWINNTYADGLYMVRLCDNELTRKYHEKFGVKMIRVRKSY